MAKIEYNINEKLYPKDPQILVQRVLSLTKLINLYLDKLYLDKNDPEYIEKVNSIDMFKAETLELHRNPNAKTTLITDWKTGLDLLRDEI